MKDFETFITLEMPERAVLLSEENTGYAGNPNMAHVDKINRAPGGTWYLDMRTGALWQKLSASDPKTWISREKGGGFESAFVLPCNPSLEIDSFVYIKGGDVRMVEKVNVGDKTKMPAIGICVEKAKPTECTIATSGIVATKTRKFLPQKVLFVGADGFPTDRIIKNSPTTVQYLQHAGIAISESSFLLRLDWPIRLAVG